MRPAISLTYDKQLAPNVAVHITNIPGSIAPGGEHDRQKQFIDRPTTSRLRHLMTVARQRMAAGETDIRIDFSDDV